MNGNTAAPVVENSNISKMPSGSNSESLWTSEQLENFLGVSRGWAAKDRCGAARIRFCRIGRSVRYRPSDVAKYLESQMRQSTADNGQLNAA